MNDSGVHYARNGSVRLAYRVLGDGDTTLVWIPGWVSNVDLWNDPSLPFVSFVEGLARATRLVMWDKRGTGLSDPVTHVPPLDERMDDLHAVMDAVGVDDAAFFGVSEGGPMSILFAATYPERVKSLALYGTMARFTPELPDHPWGWADDQARSIIEEIEAHWGEGALGRSVLRADRGRSGVSGDVRAHPACRGQPDDVPHAVAGADGVRCEWRAGRRSHADPRPRQSRRRDGALSTVQGRWPRRCRTHSFSSCRRVHTRYLDDELAAAVVNFARGKPVEDTGRARSLHRVVHRYRQLHRTACRAG